MATDEPATRFTVTLMYDRPHANEKPTRAEFATLAMTIAQAVLIRAAGAGMPLPDGVTVQDLIWMSSIFPGCDSQMFEHTEEGVVIHV